MIQETSQLLDYCRGLSRDKPFEISAERREQRSLVDDCGQRDQYEGQERNDGQQRVVSDRAREKQRLVPTERAQHAPGKSTWVPYYKPDSLLVGSHQSMRQ